MTASIMAYIPSALVSGVSGVAMVPDLANNRYYMPSEATGTHGISQFTGLLSGACTLQKTQAQLGIGAFQDFPMCLTYSGNLITPAGNGSNSIELAQFRAADLTLISTAFSSSSTLAPSSATHLLASSQMVPIRFGRTDGILSTPYAFLTGEVALLTVPGLGLVNLGNTTETGVAVMGRGKITANLGTAYVMGRQTDAFGIYLVTYAPTSLGTAMTRLRGFVPADIDATWTHFSDANGIVYDQTDGHILVGVQTTDAVTNKSYICKLSGTTGDLIWKAAVPYNNSSSSYCFALSSIVNGRFYVVANVFGTGSNVYTINTATGTFTTTLIGNLNTGQGAISEDTNDSILTLATWSQTSTVPNYIGDYMGTGGHHGPFTAWFRLFPAGPTAPLPPAPPPFIVPGAPPVVSLNRAWTFTLDGHTFYVLDLGAQGTFLYDILTSQWTNFCTGAPATNGGPNVQWNFQNGHMWGVRIVGGDLATSDVWEMTPGAVFDNGATEIGHVSTGGLAARSRVSISCDSFRITASFGLLDDVAGSTFNLRFSDDVEATWSPYFTIALTAGDYDNELAWRSLGSFAAPGRIFEISDSGGLIRIDGADAMLNGFDNDKQAQE